MSKLTFAEKCLWEAEEQGFDCALAERVPELAKKLSFAIFIIQQLDYKKLFEDEIKQLEEARNE